MDQGHKADTAHFWQENIHQCQVELLLRQFLQGYFRCSCNLSYFQIAALAQQAHEHTGKSRVVFHKQN